MITFNIYSNINLIIAKFDKIAHYVGTPEEVKEGIRDFVDETVHNIAEEARERAPRDTGRLQDSIRVEGDFPLYEFIADPVGPYGQHYAQAVERGTSKMPAQPYMAPSIERGVLILKV